MAASLLAVVLTCFVISADATLQQAEHVSLTVVGNGARVFEQVDCHTSLDLTFNVNDNTYQFILKPNHETVAVGASMTIHNELGDTNVAIEDDDKDNCIYKTTPGDAMLTWIGSTLNGSMILSDMSFVTLELVIEQGTQQLFADFGGEVGRRLSFGEIDRWTDCFTHDEVKRVLAMGVAMGSKLFTKYSSDTEARQAIQADFAKANMIYSSQLNFVLQISQFYIVENHEGAPSWDQGPSCPMSITDQSNQLDLWEASPQLGLWHLFDDCFLDRNPAGSGTIGLATTGSMCDTEKKTTGYSNRGVTWYSASTWKTFAHEIGHNFGGGHSFENGQGETGGIMDYGDGTLNGIYQFNTQFRKTEMCAVMDKQVNAKCPHISSLNPECGNKVEEPGEECECSDGSTTCQFCSNCKLDTGKDCTPDSSNGACCSSSGMFEPTTTTCFVSEKQGFCSHGACNYPDKCDRYPAFGAFCGVSPLNECKQKCYYDGVCHSLDGWVDAVGLPINNLPDDTPCNNYAGKCESGSCIASPTHSPTSEPTHSPTSEPTYSPTGEPTHSPTSEPTREPTSEPTHSPINSPTNDPTRSPTRAPAHTPTPAPTRAPTMAPSNPVPTPVTQTPTPAPTSEQMTILAGAPAIGLCAKAWCAIVASFLFA